MERHRTKRKEAEQRDTEQAGTRPELTTTPLDLLLLLNTLFTGNARLRGGLSGSKRNKLCVRKPDNSSLQAQTQVAIGRLHGGPRRQESNEFTDLSSVPLHACILYSYLLLLANCFCSCCPSTSHTYRQTYIHTHTHTNPFLTCPHARELLQSSQSITASLHEPIFESGRIALRSLMPCAILFAVGAEAKKQTERT